LIETIEKNINIKNQSEKIEKTSQNDEENKKTETVEKKQTIEKTKIIERYDNDIDHYYPEAQYTFS
jgi:hypothetical protein